MATPPPEQCLRARPIRLAFSFCRPPDAAERKLAREFFKSHSSLIAERAGAGEDLALPANLPPKFDPVRAATLVDFCHMLMNANEFVFIN